MIMVREIVRDTFFLSQKCEKATKEDIEAADDLLDTLKANSGRCVGMAANMIGVKKCIIAVNDKGNYYVMFNPEIIKKDGAFDANEGCLSLDGMRKVKRYSRIKVRYCDKNFNVRIKNFSDFAAQIIQHEADHCNGVLI